MKIGIIDDDTHFSQVIKNKIEENTCFSKSSIDVFKVVLMYLIMISNHFN